MLGAAMTVSLCACGAAEEKAAAESQTQTGTETVQASSSKDADYIALVNGREVTEEDFTYFVRYYMDYVNQNYGEVEDWTAEIGSGTTYESFVLNAALQWFLYAGAISQQANRLSISLTDEDQATLDAQWDSFVSGYDDEAAALKALEEKYCTKDLYCYIMQVQYLADKVFENMYGQNGQAMTDEECASMTEGDGYLMAKHILMLTTTTDESGTSTDMDEAAKAEVLTKMQEIKDQLNAASDEERAELFDTLMAELSEDPGSKTYTSGYLFQEGDMVTEFYEATNSLEIGGISDIVESSYGYHIIERVPVNYDVIPSAYSSYVYMGYDYLTLRYLCADEAFQNSIEQWMERVEYSTTDSYDSATIAGLCAEG